MQIITSRDLSSCMWELPSSPNLAFTLTHRFRCKLLFSLRYETGGRALLTRQSHNNVVTKVNPPMKAPIQKGFLKSRTFWAQNFSMWYLTIRIGWLRFHFAIPQVARNFSSTFLVMLDEFCRGVTRMGDLAATGKKVPPAPLPSLALIRAGKVQQKQYIQCLLDGMTQLVSH